MSISRREFIAGLGATTAVSVLSHSAFSKIFKGGAQIKFGVAAITWNGNDMQAIKDVSALGFKGIQLRSNLYKEYSTKPEVLKDLLKQYKLQLPMFSSGNININTGDDKTVMETPVNNAKFVSQLGGKIMQITNDSRPKSGSPTTDDLKKYAQLLDEVGKRTKEYGVSIAYHNHMHQLGETPEEIDIILNNCSAENVKFLLDVAHYHQGGGNPAKAIKKYASRISTLHLKDVEKIDASVPENKGRNYRFVELGKGGVDFPSIFTALDEINFNGWAIVELDSVPDKNRTPYEATAISKKFLTETLKQKI